MTTAEAAARLAAMDQVLILTHVRPDGDTIGSAAALCCGLRALGKTAYLLPNPELTATYAPYAAPYLAEADFVPAYVVSVDIAALSLLPENARPYQDRIALAIDHHPSQEFFARETCLEADSAACGEIMYDILRQLTPLTPEMALPLYVAVSTDTGCFVYSNTTPRSHRIAAQLMDCGIDVAPVNKALFRTKSAVRLAMEARMVAGMERCDAGRVVVMQIPLSLRQELHATDADIEELSALAAQVEGDRLRCDPAGVAPRHGEAVSADRPSCQRHGGLPPVGRRRSCRSGGSHRQRHHGSGEVRRAGGHRSGHRPAGPLKRSDYGQRDHHHRQARRLDQHGRLRQAAGNTENQKGGPRRDTGSHGHRRAAGVCGTGYPWRQLR